LRCFREDASGAGRSFWLRRGRRVNRESNVGVHVGCTRGDFTALFVRITPSRREISVERAGLEEVSKRRFPLLLFGGLLGSSPTRGVVSLASG
jgi:hypothetical protein